VIVLKKGEPVLLFSKDEEYLVKISDKKINTKSGMINLGKIKKKKFGDKIKSHLGKTFVIVKPNLQDVLKKMQRFPQIITSKDVGMILVYTGVGPDSLIVDAGSGSGFLAISLANYLNKGKIVTYEKDNKIFKVAKDNIKKSGLKNIILKNKDFVKSVNEKNVDLVTLDLHYPEKAINRAYHILKVGGQLFVYSPTIDELVNVLRKIKKIKGFSYVKVVENIVREWQTERTIRPKTMGLMHTGFLIFVRKVE